MPLIGLNFSTRSEQSKGKYCKKSIRNLKGSCMQSQNSGQPIPELVLLELELGFHIHSPVELAEQGLVENLLHGHLLPLAPGDGDAGVQVIYLGRAQGHLRRP